MALFVALTWIDSIELLLGSRVADRGGNPGWEQNLAASDADIVQAIKYARGAVHHQWWAAMVLHVVPATAHNERTNTWRWANLPANPNRRDKTGREAYERALCGRPVIESINALRRVFREQVDRARLSERLYLSVP
jgi:hypothetical protein